MRESRHKLSMSLIGWVLRWMQREREILEKVREIGEEQGQQVMQDVTRRLPPPKITQAGPVRCMLCMPTLPCSCGWCPCACCLASCALHVHLPPCCTCTRFNKRC